MSMSIILLGAACLVVAIMIGAGGIVLALFLTNQRDKSNTHHD